MPISDKDADLLDFLTDRRDVAVDAVDPFVSEWDENKEFYLSKQWNDSIVNSKASWRNSITDNIILPFVEQIRALMTDERPMAYCERRSNGTFRMQQIFSSILEQWWIDADMEYKNSLMCQGALLYGSQIPKVSWDFKNKGKRLLPIDCELINIRDFFPDPLAEKMEECRYVFERKIMALSDVIEEYPDKADELYTSGSDEFEGKINRDTNEIIGEPDISVWECWFKDSTRIVETMRDEDTGEEVKKSKRKYPTGRYVRFIADIVLEDKKNPYPWWPYLIHKLIPVDDEFWGYSIVTPLKHPQEKLNQLESMLFDNTKSNINSIFVATEGALDLDEFVPIPNSVITIPPDGKFDRVQGAQLPSEVFNLVGMTKEEGQNLSGVNQYTLGQSVGSARPGTVRANFNASVTRVREYVRTTNRTLSEIGNRVINLIQLFLPADTVLTISDTDDDVTDLLSPENQSQVNKALEGSNVQNEMGLRQVTLNETNPEFQAQAAAEKEPGAVYDEEIETRNMLKTQDVKQFKNNVKEGEYFYRVKIHPIQDRDLDLVFDFAIQLVQFNQADPTRAMPGFIDYEYLWELLPMPDKHRLVRRLRKKEREMKAAIEEQKQQQNAVESEELSQNQQKVNQEGMQDATRQPNNQ